MLLLSQKSFIVSDTPCSSHLPFNGLQPRTSGKIVDTGSAAVTEGGRFEIGAVHSPTLQQTSLDHSAPFAYLPSKCRLAVLLKLLAGGATYQQWGGDPAAFGSAHPAQCREEYGMEEEEGSLSLLKPSVVVILSSLPSPHAGPVIQGGKSRSHYPFQYKWSCVFVSSSPPACQGLCHAALCQCVFSI